LKSHSSLYETLTSERPKIAPDSDHGQLSGTVVRVEGKTAMTLNDFTGQTWTVDISAANFNLDNPMQPGDELEIHGTRTGPAAFRAQTVEDWE
jgi:hypothetical protein